MADRPRLRSPRLLPLLAGCLAGPLHAGSLAATGASLSLPSVIEATPTDGVEIRYRSDIAGALPTGPGRLEGLVTSDEWKLRSSVRVSPDADLSLRVQRLDVGLQFQAPGPFQTVVVGDTLASGGGWSRPVRLGGVRFGRGLTLRPGFDTHAQPAASTAAAVPRAALGFARNGFESLALVPGPAAAPGLAPIADVVHLGPGASDYEVELGRLRSGWGTVDDQYGEHYLAAGYRRGLGADLTAEARAEWTPSRHASGIEIAHGNELGGTLAAVLAHSQAQGLDGLRAGMLLAGESLGAHWRLAWDGFEEGWTPAAAAADELLPRMRLRGSARTELTDQLSAGLTVGRQSAWNAETARILALSLRWSLPHGTSMALNVNDRGGVTPTRQHTLVLEVPLDDIGR